MLLKTNVMRSRVNVYQIDDQGQVTFSIYPESVGSVQLKADSRMVNDDLDYASLKVGDKLDALVVRFAEYAGVATDGMMPYKKDKNGHVVYKYVAVGIEKPSVHPYELKQRPPNEFPCITAKVVEEAHGRNRTVIAEKVVDGEVMRFKINSKTPMLQAQFDMQKGLDILEGLEVGASINLFGHFNTKANSDKTVAAPRVYHIDAMSVNYR